jgi:hypothetical protein
LLLSRTCSNVSIKSESKSIHTSFQTPQGNRRNMNFNYMLVLIKLDAVVLFRTSTNNTIEMRLKLMITFSHWNFCFITKSYKYKKWKYSHITMEELTLVKLKTSKRLLFKKFSKFKKLSKKHYFRPPSLWLSIFLTTTNTFVKKKSKNNCRSTIKSPHIVSFIKRIQKYII